MPRPGRSPCSRLDSRWWCDVRAWPLARSRSACVVRRVINAAALMPVEVIAHRLAPEDLLGRQASEDLPVFRVLAELRPLLDALGHVWGVTGSAGFQLATGLPTAHPDSDLDLLLRTERPLPRSEARPLLQLLEGSACRVDLQLETPLGGLALREWAGTSSRVLVKTADGPRLVDDPWHAEQAA